MQQKIWIQQDYQELKIKYNFLIAKAELELQSTNIKSNSVVKIILREETHHKDWGQVKLSSFQIPNIGTSSYNNRSKTKNIIGSPEEAADAAFGGARSLKLTALSTISPV